MSRTPPPFRADQVGSLVRPPELIAARERFGKGEASLEELERIQHAAIREVVARQEEIGLQAVTDGEFNRASWQTDFLLKFANVQPAESRFSMRFHSEKGETEGRPHTVRVVGKLARPRPLFVEDFKFLKSVAHAMPKITVPSPSVVHFRGGRAGIDAEAYPDLAEFYRDLARVYREEIADLAAAGCRYLQLDEVNLAYLCDPELREDVRHNIGENPDVLPRTYAALINDAVAGRPTDMTVCLHLCRGNFAGNWMASGGYEPVAEVLFNEVGVDGYFLEYDTARAGGFEPLRLVPKGKRVVLGLVTTKRGQIERTEDIVRRIDEASRFLPLEQLGLSPQCGFASGIAGATMSTAEQFAKLKLIVEVAREVWGEQ
ncbi:MAG TPA: 5-methyltetrahydropteroyltriglutamate--homocysteine S-methyltransferase [Steroidobacteraceae bacterium]|nr:5-methyltetrahydropteroyltriglutamate--homocysteine S-methyltransferase [Steroidobacteraceae bacterium]